MTSPLLAAGTVDVTVTTPAGTSSTSLADSFTFESAPTVSGVSPVAGPLSGGTQVTITGTNFAGASTVDFGNQAATSFTILSATTITAPSPSQAAGSVDITVTSSSGTSATSSADRFSYESPPTVSAVSPVAGLPAGGSSVTITGTGFTGTSAVHFATAAAAFTVISATTITTTSPSGSVGPVDVTVTTPAGTSATSAADQFSYEGVPNVSSVSPVAGLVTGGASVSIVGSGFSGASAVEFGTTAATTFTVVSSTEITAASPPASAGSLAVTVTTPVGASATSAADVFTYEDAPTVSGLSPLAGAPAGGTLVNVVGTGFTGATTVDFGDRAASSITVNSASSITATSPAQGPVTTDVIVTTPVGVSATSAADKFIYEAVPTVSSLSPVAGTPSGGTAVTITGSGFGAASTVSFGGVLASSFSVVSSSEITVSSPSSAAGSIDVTVTTPVGTSASTASGEFTYEAAPSVSGLTPDAGLPAGGTTVTVTGGNFSQVSAVSFGALAANDYTVDSASSIIATSPAQSGVTVDVTVTTPVATSALSGADHFTYEPAPSVTALSPVAGLPAGGATVVLSGSNFAQASAVEFGTVSASYTVNSPTQITATSPAGSGIVEVTVTTPSGTSSTSIADEFTYEAAPILTGLSPVSGPTAGGTSVILAGTNLTGTSTVDFGTFPAASYTVNSATQISAVSPAQAAGGVDVTVVTPLGTSATSAADRFTYQATPSVTALSPLAGPLAGGTTVDITGTNFTGATRGPLRLEPRHGRLGHLVNLDHSRLPLGERRDRGCDHHHTHRDERYRLGRRPVHLRDGSERRHRRPARRRPGRRHGCDNLRSRLEYPDHRCVPGRLGGHGRRHGDHALGPKCGVERRPLQL